MKHGIQHGSCQGFFLVSLLLPVATVNEKVCQEGVQSVLLVGSACLEVQWDGDVVGGFDFFNFQRKNEITMEVERKRVKPVVGTYDAATFSFNTFDAEIKEGMIDAVDYLEVTSGWIQEGEFELLQHLVKSKLVYIVNDDATLTPVVMETNSFLVNKERNAKLKSVSFRLRIAQQNIQ